MRAPVLSHFIVSAAACFAAVSSAPAADSVLQERAPLFAYDARAGLAVTPRATERRGEVTVADVTFLANPGGPEGRVDAYVVTPAGAAPCAGVLWVHWLGEPDTTNRTEFLDEAVALAGRGVVSVLVDAMWARPHWYRDRALEDDFENSVRQVIAIRRALDLLRAQPRVDPARVAYVGHDYGAMYGTIAIALDGAVRTAVLLTPTPSFNDWAFFAKKPAAMDAYLAENAPLELRDFLRAMHGPNLFLQFAGKDEYVPADKAAAWFAAANEPKTMKVYPEAGHEMTQPAAIREERTAWLVRELGL